MRTPHVRRCGVVGTCNFVVFTEIRDILKLVCAHIGLNIHFPDNIVKVFASIVYILLFAFLFLCGFGVVCYYRYGLCFVHDFHNE